ncbi:MAG TPA: hypothetical protein VFA97_10450 [Gaiellaceae bacterium]|nr:hypothetical protein [Gaiellaceae bacterium]
MKTIAASADDLLGSATGGVAPDGAAPAADGVGGRIRRLQDVSVVGAVVVTEAAWVVFLAYELWFRLL